MTAFVSRLNIVEALYVMGRLVGWHVAEERVLMLLESGMIEVVEDEKV